MNRATIISTIKRLNNKAFNMLIDAFHQLKQSGDRKPACLTDLNGLGSEIWSDIDVEDYVRQQRDWD